MRRRPWYLVLVVAASVGLPARLAAQADDGPLRPETLETPRTIAMGTGARASAISTGALAQNPAALPAGRLYHLEGIFGVNPDRSRFFAGANVVDSVTNQLAAGLSVRGLFGGDDSQYSGLDGRLSIGFPIGQAVSVGVSGRYLTLSAKDQELTGSDSDDSLVKGFTLDAAIQVRPSEYLQIAALGYNLLDLESSLAPRMLGGSVSLTPNGALAIGVDGLVDLTSFEDTEWLIGGGIEYLSGGSVPIRAGYRFDHGRQIHALGAGLGYVDRAYGIDIGFDREVSGGDETRLVASLRYHLQ